MLRSRASLFVIAFLIVGLVQSAVWAVDSAVLEAQKRRIEVVKKISPAAS